MSRSPAPGPLVEVSVATLGLVVPLLGLVAGQAVLALRRYGASPAVDRVDVTVKPSGGAPAGAAVIEIAAFGDSAMAGVGVHQPADALPVQLAQRVADSAGHPVHVVGYARAGARTIDVLARQVPLVRRVPDVSVLVIGTNDVTGITPPATLLRLSSALLDALESLGAPVVMSSLPEFRAMRLMPHPLMEAVLGYGAVVGAVQRRAAADRPLVHLVDVRGAVGSEFFNEGTMSADAFHPSAVGYGRIADALVPAVLSVLGTAQTLETTHDHQAE
ncbi:MAG TPA: SGNH/GDSL hydrolase family protein [Propionicimonas sp.]|uniref:SGNH/GDSL hydrolase family protein n=1 Tax=Propionicimonas sp. TaxID=1955623 RepID=UPI002F42D69A